VARKARLVARQLGIRQRHLARPLQRDLEPPEPDAPALCIEALQQAAHEAHCAPADLDYLIGHTTTPHTLVPPNIAWVAERLQLANPYMELRQACTGFANALQIAAPMLGGGSAEAIAIVGSEVGSAFFRPDADFIDEEQLVNAVQMGDGAGAVILAAAGSRQRHRISDMYMGHIGSDRAPGFYLDGGGSGSVHCDRGIPRFRHNRRAVREQGGDLYLAGLQAIASRGYGIEDFAYLLPHQANGHLASLLAQHLGIDAERIVVDADRLGNLGSAAIWVSLDRLRRSGRLSPGDKVLVLGAEATKYLYGGFVYQH
jgi:3-oxoacyl-[acyl-carrier-protein] synthase-3